MFNNIKNYIETEFTIIKEVADTKSEYFPLKLNKNQNELLSHITKHNIVFDIYDRRSGVTTLLEKYITYYIMNNSNKHIFISSCNYETSRSFLNRIKISLFNKTKFCYSEDSNMLEIDYNKNKLFIWKSEHLNYVPDLMVCDNFINHKDCDIDYIYSMIDCFNKEDKKLIMVSTKDMKQILTGREYDMPYKENNVNHSVDYLIQNNPNLQGAVNILIQKCIDNNIPLCDYDSYRNEDFLQKCGFESMSSIKWMPHTIASKEWVGKGVIRKDTGETTMISRINPDLNLVDVVGTLCRKTLKELFNEYTWLDGRIIGILEK